METTKNKFAVIHVEQIHHEGDERSRTAPGHGYPAYTEDVQKITTFKDEAELKLVIANAACIINAVAGMLESFLPETTKKIREQITIADSEIRLKKGESLFLRLNK